MPVIPYPSINGNRFDFSSIEVNLFGQLFGGFRAVNYKPQLDPGEARGNRAQMLGRTRGKYTVDGSFEIYASEYDAFTTLLVSRGLGIYEQSFDVVINYAEVLSSPITDILNGCRLKSSDRSNKEGNEALVVKCDLSIMYCIENGKMPMGVKQFLR